MLSSSVEWAKFDIMSATSGTSNLLKSLRFLWSKSKMRFLLSSLLLILLLMPEVRPLKDNKKSLSSKFSSSTTSSEKQSPATDEQPFGECYVIISLSHYWVRYDFYSYLVSPDLWIAFRPIFLGLDSNVCYLIIWCDTCFSFGRRNNLVVKRESFVACLCVWNSFTSLLVTRFDKEDTKSCWPSFSFHPSLSSSPSYSFLASNCLPCVTTDSIHAIALSLNFGQKERQASLLLSFLWLPSLPSLPFFILVFSPSSACFSCVLNSSLTSASFCSESSLSFLSISHSFYSKLSSFFRTLFLWSSSHFLSSHFFEQTIKEWVPFLLFLRVFCFVSRPSFFSLMLLFFKSLLYLMSYLLSWRACRLFGFRFLTSDYIFPSL